MPHACGEGVAKDLAQAEKWLILASAQGEKDAVISRNVLEGTLSATQIEEAKKQAMAFAPKRAHKKSAGKKASSSD